ncbi:TlpA family protein disulfide reductase [Mycolicibacterium neworleansense]|uniref:Alkyl hydroperoxide reductase/ Thiol specific antioxidant/ Mal allergen n=1 Tax=Mycolicibacterium neworleansense TaxID=146018 RepID=A0A0H5RV72_9MYCO|nr:TlpA disulfide reductase family protein [Mycolicibacterium neworleansense]MCV7360580.1 TlpA family protein disulfide reductase [Mycolicibacterium neworleansense]CRZ17803.1 alkyl hydroperoxide reductase/ Thiol specific antioxidant/ Mal allergen [Mycolicibacterium neworleansense]
MTRSARWTVAVLVVLVALGTAFWMELRDEPAPQAGPAQSTSRDHRDADTPEALAGPRARADLPPCPAPGKGPGSEALRGITLDCAGDGKPVDVASALAGRTVVLNLWAYWCGPCADELPAMAEYQRRVGDDVLVVTVHQDENETAALVRLAELGVRLPTLQDGRRLVAAALKVPNVMPATVVLRPDGSVAGTLPRSFVSADEIAAAVDEKIRSSR